MDSWKNALILLAMCACMVPAQAATKLPDRIVPTSGPTLSGVKILSATIDTIKYNTKFWGGGRDRSMPAAQVKELGWGDSPAAFRVALADYNRKNYGKALPRLEKLPASAARDFWYVPYKNVLHGNCLLRLGKHAEALPKFKVVVDKHSDSFYVLEAILGKAKCHEALQQYEEAGQAYAKLDPNGVYQDPDKNKPYGKLWQLRGRLGMAQSYAKVKAKRGAAAAVLSGLAKVTALLLADTPKALVGAVDEIKSINQNASVGKAQVLLGEGKVTEASDWIASIAHKVSDPSARVQLFMMLGDIAMKAADGAADQEDKKLKYKQALLAYMRVYIVYSEAKEVRPRAMYLAGQAYERQGTAEARNAAARLYRELRKSFPDSEWAKKARTALEALGRKADG